MKNDIVTFKGSREGLIVYCQEDADWDGVLECLEERLQGKEGVFFEGASVLIDTGERLLSPEQVSSLWGIFQRNGLTVKSIKMEKRETSVKTKLGTRVEMGIQREDEINKLSTLIVKRNVRSGQDITFAGNIIIFGDVNPGAEITASGYIVVFGELRGTAHAGASGDEDAWVGAISLQPTQLRIANYITRAPDEEPQYPEIAEVWEGSIVVREMRRLANYFISQ